jgi:hypothetical protein
MLPLTPTDLYLVASRRATGSYMRLDVPRCRGDSRARRTYMITGLFVFVGYCVPPTIGLPLLEPDRKPSRVPRFVCEARQRFGSALTSLYRSSHGGDRSPTRYGSYLCFRISPLKPAPETCRLVSDIPEQPLTPEVIQMAARLRGQGGDEARPSAMGSSPAVAV